MLITLVGVAMDSHLPRTTNPVKIIKAHSIPLALVIPVISVIDRVKKGQHQNTQDYGQSESRLL